jgi:hypothetical protein
MTMDVVIRVYSPHPAVRRYRIERLRYAPSRFLAASSDRRRWWLNPKGAFSGCSEMSRRTAGVYRRSERRCLLAAHLPLDLGIHLSSGEHRGGL